MKRGDMSLETVAKALLVIAVVVIMLIIFRRLFTDSGNDLGDLRNESASSAKNCLQNPEGPDCIWFKGTDDNSQVTPETPK